MVPSGEYPPSGQSFLYLEQDPMVAARQGGMPHLGPNAYGKQAGITLQHRVSPNSSEASSNSGLDSGRAPEMLAGTQASMQGRPQADGRSPHLIMQQNQIAAFRQRALLEQRAQAGTSTVTPQQGGPAYPQPSLLSGHPGMQGQPHGMTVQSYGMAQQQPTGYNHQDRRASSPAAMFVPSAGGPSQQNLMAGHARPIPPPLVHHHISDYSQGGSQWQDRQPYPHVNQMQPAPGPPPHYTSMQPYPQYGAATYPMPPSEAMQARPPYGYPPQMIPGHPLHGQYIMEDDDGDEYGGTRQPFDPYRVKHRKRTSPEQLAVLEAAFDQNSKPSAVERKAISEQIGMTSRAVQVWFQNRRQKKKLAERKQLDSAADAENDMYGQPGGMGPSINLGGQAGYYGAPVPSASPSGRGAPSSVDVIDNDNGLGWSTTPANGIHHPGHDVPVHMRLNMANPAMRPQPQVQPPINNGRGSPMISQVRRGSLPYPPPQASAVNQQYRPVHGNTLGVPLPARLIPGMDRRRSSLPGNPRSISSNSNPLSRGSHTPVESVQMSQNGSQGSVGRIQGLSPIADHEPSSEAEGGPKQGQQSESPTSAGPDGRSNFATSSQPEFAVPGHMQGDQFYVVNPAGPLFADNYAMGQAPQTSQSGPLPNPSFSFGAGVDGGPGKDAYAQPSGADLPPFHPASVFRGRMGSMASILSQATTDGGATTDGTSSDWDRNTGAYAAYQQAIAPIDMSLQTPQDEMPKALGQVQPHLSAVPPGFQADLRRASAPAELLAKFSGLDVELPGGGLLHRPSPLGAAVLSSPDEREEAGQQVKTPLKASPATSAKTVSPPIASAATPPATEQAEAAPVENVKTAADAGAGSAAQNALLYSAGVEGDRARNESIDINYMYPSSGGTGFTPILGGDFGQFNEEWIYGSLGAVNEAREEEAS